MSDRRTVFMVVDSDGFPLTTHSTREKAEAVCPPEAGKVGGYRIEEVEIDPDPPPLAVRKYWNAQLHRDSVEAEMFGPFYDPAHPNDLGSPKTIYLAGDVPVFYGKSYVSPEHATQLAREERERWLSRFSRFVIDARPGYPPNVDRDARTHRDKTEASPGE